MPREKQFQAWTQIEPGPCDYRCSALTSKLSKITGRWLLMSSYYTRRRWIHGYEYVWNIFCTAVKVFFVNVHRSYVHKNSLSLFWWTLRPPSGKSHKMSFLAKGKQALFNNIFHFLNWLVRNTSQTYRLVYISGQNTLITSVWAAWGKAPKDKRAHQRKFY